MDRGVKSTDAITQTLASVPGGQLEEVLGRMKVGPAFPLSSASRLYAPP